MRAYGEALFKGTEEQFRDWAEREGALYYVYALGEFANVGLISRCAIWLMLYNRGPTRRRGCLNAHRNSSSALCRYGVMQSTSVFRIRCRADARIAADQAELADQVLQAGSTRPRRNDMRLEALGARA